MWTHVIRHRIPPSRSLPLQSPHSPGRRTPSRSGVAIVALYLAAILSGCPHRPAQSPPAPRPTIVFMTDFGTANDSAAICKAVIIGIAPGVRIMDITHQVTPFSIEEGARFLAGVSPYYPSGTIFLAVVDPGVASTRKAVVVKPKKGQFFVLPDNGLITPVLERDGLDAAREITNTSWMLTPAVSSTFHGRDIFSPAAAHLPPRWDWPQVGPRFSRLVPLRPPLPTT